jgi:Ser/Thr protein kinase RdoA (MazF antagonist)
MDGLAFAFGRSGAATRAPGHLPSPQTDDITPGLFRNLGRTLGKMHALTQRYPRKLGCAIGNWRGEWQSCSTASADERIQRMWQEMGTQLAALPQPVVDLEF